MGFTGRLPYLIPDPFSSAKLQRKSAARPQSGAGRLGRPFGGRRITLEAAGGIRKQSGASFGYRNGNRRAAGTKWAVEATGPTCAHRYGVALQC